MYAILIDDAGWQLCGEGPWDDYDAALAFAEAEVGLPWAITVIANRSEL